MVVKMCNEKSVNQQVKEGETAGIGIGCNIGKSKGTLGFLMNKDKSFIEIKIEGNQILGIETLKVEVSSSALLGLSRIITATLK